MHFQVLGITESMQRCSGGMVQRVFSFLSVGMSKKGFHLLLFRSKKYPQGLPDLGARPKAVTRLANKVTANTVKLCEHFCSVGTPWSVENPHSSLLWETRAFRKLARIAGINVIVLDFCRYGTPYRKRTRLLTWHPMPERRDYLQPLAARCNCTVKHVTLSGWGERGQCIPTGKGSSAYPASLCAHWAQTMRVTFAAGPAASSGVSTCTAGSSAS